MQDRGTLFIGPGVDVYAGMIVGVCNRNEDMSVNVCKKKQLTNMRAAGSDEAIRNAFSAEPKDNALFLPGVMSRKKQVIPMLSALWG